MVLNVVLIALGLIVLALVIVLVYAATKPDAFRVQRRRPSRPARAGLPLINDFSSWRLWSPWEKKDRT